MSNSLTYKAVDFGGASYGFIVEQNGFAQGFVPPRVYRQGLSVADGEATQGATFGARVGAVRGKVIATSYANLLTQRANIEAALSAGQTGVQTLTFDAISGKQWSAKVLGVNWDNETSITAELSITFEAPQPWPVATSETSVTGTSVSAGGTTI